ncbi:MAG: glycosyltransferase family 2 protein [Desulfobacteraceae bacterium]|nr:glycosyltransferase family 2 protein [Desulfobacteraceae bacterium]
MGSLKISVVIPTFNKGAYLKSILPSFCQLNFDDQEFEVIVCNDGSLSEDYEFIHDLELPFSFTYIFVPNNRGSATARNFAIKKARGNLVVFTDDDTWVDPQFLTKHWQLHQQYSDCIIMGKRKQVYLSDHERSLLNELKNSFLSLPVIQERASEDIYASATKEIIFKDQKSSHWLAAATGNLSIKRTILEEQGGFDETFQGWGFEDLDLAYRLSKKGFRFCYGPDCLNYHIEHKRKKRQMVVDMKNNLELFLNKNENTRELQLFRDFFIGRICINEFDRETYCEIGKEVPKTFFPLFKRTRLNG